ncbi:hypothetical protein NHX12_012738 [Muraenolepis orangiensis]|uniref:Uncharacterized protein n=1 Tax=Muraenolepis orangiensis TaxID=630683 RepID=A0A9Q0DEY8_9TELE|nr:hypothetical protein NHX12_012738 [Muraenolepis orangiensis]
MDANSRGRRQLPNRLKICPPANSPSTRTPAKLPRYGGATPLKPYLAQIWLAGQFSRWGNEEAVVHQALLLEDPAAQVLLDLRPGDRGDFTSLTAALERWFGQRQSTDESREKLRNCCRREGERKETGGGQPNEDCEQDGQAYPYCSPDEDCDGGTGQHGGHESGAHPHGGPGDDAGGLASPHPGPMHHRPGPAAIGGPRLTCPKPDSSADVSAETSSTGGSTRPAAGEPSTPAAGESSTAAPRGQDVSRRGVHETSRRGPVNASHQGVRDVIYRGFHETSRRGAVNASRWGVVDASRQGVRDVSRRGVHETSRRGVVWGASASTWVCHHATCSVPVNRDVSGCPGDVEKKL